MKWIFLFLLLLISISGQGQQFWLIAPSFPGGPKTAISVHDENTFLVGTIDGVYKTIDQGNDFEASLQGQVIYCLYETESGILLAGSTGRIFRSEDLGDSWDTIQMNHTYPVRKMVESATGELFTITGVFVDTIGFLGEGVFFSGDDGQTWTSRSNGLTSTRCAEAIAIDKNDRVYVSIADDNQTGEAGLFYSDNSGLSWHQVQVKIDGRGAIPDDIRVYNISGLSVSPADSVYISLSGSAVNSGVNLNLHKSIDDLTMTNYWQVVDVAGNISWWNDRQLFDIHFAQNGDWYSSSVGSVNLGKTWFSKDKGLTWSPHDEGLGLDWIGRRNIQFFDEAPSGRVYMVQLFAELIHYTDTSRLMVSTPFIPETENTIVISPNPVSEGQSFSIDVNEKWLGGLMSIYSADGVQVAEFRVTSPLQTIPAPAIPGNYYITLVKGKMYSIVPFITQ